MEFIEGTDVHQLIASEEQIDARRAVQIVTAVCEADYEEAGKGDLFRALRPVLIEGGSLRDEKAPVIAAQLVMNEPALNRMLRHYRKILVHEVRETVEHSEDVDTEIAHLMSVMGRR